MTRHILLTGVLSVLILTVSLPAAAPPATLTISRWIEELASEDSAVWKRASDALWRAGDKALPALRAARKHPDPDVVLRAALLVGKLEWGIYFDTPPTVAAEIDRFRLGDQVQKDAALVQLGRQGRPGMVALRLLVAREPNESIRKKITDLLKTLIRPAARDLIARGDLAEAERLLASAGSSNSEVMRDLVALWLLSGKAEDKIKELELIVEKDRDRVSEAALLRRAMGDLPAARKLVEGKDPAVYAGILAEQEDYMELAKVTEKPKSNRHLASLLWRSGEEKKFEIILNRIASEDKYSLPYVLFYNGRPRQGIEAMEKNTYPSLACSLLVAQGRWREAMAIAPPENDLHFGHAARVCFEQAVLAHRMGDKKRSGELFAAGMKYAAPNDPNLKQLPLNDGLMAARLKAGKGVGQINEALDDIGQVLDRLKPKEIPSALFSELSSRDADALSAWWECLRSQQATTEPSATLKLLRDWFVTGKADKDFDTTLKTAEGFRSTNPTRQWLWAAARARVYERVGRLNKAEELLKKDAQDAQSTRAYQHLGDFYFGQKRWKEAAAEYEKALKLDPTLPVPTYLRGVALTRSGDEKEGKAIIARARLLPLADDYARYTLAQRLDQLGLADEAADERLVLVRVGAFGSVPVSNASSALADRLARQKKYSGAARYYRQLFANVSFGGFASFIDERAYLMVPGRAHLNETRARIESGKLDDALTEARQLWRYLPDEKEIVVELVRALEKADRKEDADKLFVEQFALLQRECVETPLSPERHNRLAWLAARCGRRLDVALRHAKRLTELDPKASATFDTLAEVHFQRGDKDEALSAIKQAVKLSPKMPYYAAQLKRIEAGDPKAELPSR